ncbi:MAG: hypothetical protein ACR2PJ_06025, partial [Pseudomonadales bacterium]
CPVEGGRIELTKTALSAYWHTYWKFTAPLNDPTELVKLAPGHIAVNHDKARSLGLEVDEVIASLKAFFEARPGIKQAWTQDEIMRGKSDMAALYRNSYVPHKSGDLLMQMHETCLAWYDAGTSHGSPYKYDRDIPLVFYGAGITPGSSKAPAHSTDLAPTLAKLLGLRTPDNLDGRSLSLTPDN